ncbi:hypothetical protein OPW32_23165 [Vibrio europaeus]|uniref:hypothetical protein n=1 Tax=Vibrio europaeus TaxID=300876 RepID=UPI0023408FAE|nr:hypothetical protein [Vibrio europaeus]MDC5852097.1 hypothetical protein [Vibrio europaeus]
MEWPNFAVWLDTGVEMVRQGVDSDSRASHQIFYSGCGYVGSCFLKDVQVLAQF